MRGANELGQLALAVLDWSASQILALELDQIEGAQHRIAAMARPADEFEYREAFVVGDDRLAVDQKRPTRQRRDRCRGKRKPGSEIVAVAADKPDTACVAPGHDAEAVVLDLVNPVRPGRRSLGG